MRSALLGFWLVALTSGSTFAMDASEPPENIVEHFEWCGAAKDIGARIARFAGCWTRYHPKDEEYEDAIHHTFVGLTAYRLAALYADAKHPQKCTDTLRSLESHDRLFRDESTSTSNQTMEPTPLSC